VADFFEALFQKRIADLTKEEATEFQHYATEKQLLMLILKELQK